MATRRLKAIIEAEDRASATFKKVGSAVAALGAVAAAVGAVQIGRTLARGLGTAVKVSAEYESATTRLGVALRNQGRLTAETSDELTSFSRAQSLVSTATENQILSAVAQATTMGASTEAAKALTAAATDLAVATGVDLDTAFRQVNRTLGGYAGELGEIIPELKDLTEEQLRAGAAAEIIARQMGGAGAAAAKTFEGSINNLNSEISRLQRGIGAPFRDVITKAAQALTPIISELADATIASAGFRDAVVKSAIGLTHFGSAVEAVVKSPGFQFLVILGFAKLKSDLEAVDKIFGAVTSKLEGFGGGLLFDRDAAEGGVFAQLREQLESLLSTNLSGSLISEDTLEGTRASITVVKGDLIDLAEAAARVVQQGVTVTAAAMDEADESIKSLGLTIRQQLKGGGVSAALQFGSTLVDAARGAEVAFDELFEQLLADIAKAIVQALILKSILSFIPGGSSLFGFSQGGIAGVGTPAAAVSGASGLLVTGVDLGRDSVLAAVRPGEAILPPQLTDFLLEAASGATGTREPLEIVLHTDLPATVEVLNAGVRAGTMRVTATDLAGPRSVR